ncbi:putative membrane protein, partial [Chlamydia psittaci 02DC15]
LLMRVFLLGGLVVMYV